MKAILTRFKANGGSAYDPLPTLAHHLYHMLAASVVALLLRDIIAWYILGPVLTFIAVGAEYAQYKGWIGRNRASASDSLFDAYQYQAHWIWYWPLIGAGTVFAVFAALYFVLLLKLVDENGNGEKI